MPTTSTPFIGTPSPRPPFEDSPTHSQKPDSADVIEAALPVISGSLSRSPSYLDLPPLPPLTPLSKIRSTTDPLDPTLAAPERANSYEPIPTAPLTSAIRDPNGSLPQEEAHPPSIQWQNSYVPPPLHDPNLGPPEVVCTQSGSLIPRSSDSRFTENGASTLQLTVRENSYVPPRPLHEMISRSESELAVCTEQSIHELIGGFLAQENLTIGPEIGRGYSSTVFQLTQDSDQRMVGAIKILNPDDRRKGRNVAIAARHFHSNFGEHLVLPIRHPSILSPQRCLYLHNGEIIEHPLRRSRIIAQVLPFFEGISLKEAIQDGLSEQQIRLFGSQIASGIAHLNASRVVHGDFHPDNILIGRDGNAVIIDFGLSHKIDQDEGVRFGKGKLVHQAPEVAFEIPHKEKAESWSFGVILYQMLHQGKVPFRNLNEILNKPLWIDPFTPRDLAALIRNLLIRNPDHRLSIYKASNLLKNDLAGKPPKLKTD